MFDSSSCWQHLVRREQEKTVENVFRHVKAAQTEVKKITLATARSFIERFEWLGNVGSSQLCFGLFFRDEILSVSCFTRAVSPLGFATLIPSVSRDQIYQLCRGATAAHAPKWAGSRVIGGSLVLLHRLTGARYVFAYGDPRAGEIGVVYQASNAIYLGLTDARGPGEYVVNGQRLTPRTVFRRFGTAKDEVLRGIDPGYERIQRVKKHRYVFLLGSSRAKRHAFRAIAHLRKSPPVRKAQPARKAR